MSKQITLTVPESVVRRAEQLAHSSHRPVDEVLREHIQWGLPRFHISKDDPAMEREVAAYEAMHPQLWAEYPNQYVAVHQGSVVDVDYDKVALLSRKRKEYPNQVVLIRQVLPELPKPFIFRSVRVERTQ
jgi:hypothetical protein